MQVLWNMVLNNVTHILRIKIEQSQIVSVNCMYHSNYSGVFKTDLIVILDFKSIEK